MGLRYRTPEEIERILTLCLSGKHNSLEIAKITGDGREYISAFAYKRGIKLPPVRAELRLGVKAPTKIPVPTMARPGSPEKLEVLAQRALNREELWHPLDAKADLR